MNGWKNWILAIVGSLLVLGVGGSFGLGFNLAGDMAQAKERIAHNTEDVGEVEDLASNNERKINETRTEWEWFKDQYRRDQSENQEAHKKILEKLDSL